MAETPQTSQIKSHFDDFDQFALTMQGWDLHFSQLDRGSFEGKLHQIGIPGILISDVYFNRHLLQEGDPSEGMRTFAIMTDNSIPFVWYKYKTTQRSLMVFPKGAGLDATSFPGFRVYVLSISEQTLSEKLHWEDQLTLSDLFKWGGVVEVSPEKIQALRLFLKQLFWIMEGRPDLINKVYFQKELKSNVARMISGIIRSKEEQIRPIPISKRTILIENIRSWLHEALPDHHSVYDLCETFQVNERTVQRAFMECYGVPPKQYLLALRLNKVRKELRRDVHSHGKIAEIANRWGFWHMGHFAQVYRRQFGELPSETLRRFT